MCKVEQDMEVRKAAKQMEVLWRGTKSFGDSADVFTANFPTGHLLQVGPSYICLLTRHGTSLGEHGQIMHGGSLPTTSAIEHTYLESDLN